MGKVDLAPAVSLIKQFEGCKLKAYKDPVGILTIGFGTTKGVKPGQVITLEQAEKLLADDIKSERLPAIGKCVTAPLTNHELCALVSFVYNVGNTALAKSTLVKKLNAGKPRVEIADEFLKWNKAKGKVLKGLVRRRAAERELFLTREVVSFVNMS